MAKVQVNTVAEAVHKLQLTLLDGIKEEAQLFAAGSLISRSDYEDVVTERSIAESCGYPLCPNSLPSERARKGHYRISLKEHKVYDLHETYMYCSSNCLISSRTFAGNLPDKRCMGINPAKLTEILSMFENLGLEYEKEMGKSGDLGISKLKIQEKPDIKGGEVAMEEWIGPSNAIEGYVPQRDRKLKALSLKKGSEPGKVKSSKQNDTSQPDGGFRVAVKPNGDTSSPKKTQGKKKNSGGTQTKKPIPLFDDMNFTSCIIMDGEYTVSKESDGGSKAKRYSSKKGKESGLNIVDFTSTIIPQFEYTSSSLPSSLEVSNPNQISSESIEKLDLGDREKHIQPSEVSAVNGRERSINSGVTETRMITNESLRPSSYSKATDSCQNYTSSSSVDVQDESGTHQDVQSSKTRGKSSLKSNGARKLGRSVTWADKKNDNCDSGNLREVKEFKKTTENTQMLKGLEGGDNDDPVRVASAQACAVALSQAAEAVASGQSDVTDAVSEAGILVLPGFDKTDEGDCPEDCDGLEEAAPIKWPRKPGEIFSDDVFESKDSWVEIPPEGFSLILSPFANMWNALFSWTTSSSLAYIYGRDESFHVEYLFVNGREYPSRAVLPDGRSSEIKHTLAGCLSRASPGVIASLKLPTPVSTLEQGLDLQVKSSPPVQAVSSSSSIHNDPAIIQSHYPHLALTSANMPPTATEVNMHAPQLGHVGSNFQGGLPLYQPGGNLGPWGPLPPPGGSGGGLTMPMYWPGFYAPHNGLPHLPQQPLFRPPPGLSMPPSLQQQMQYSGFNSSSLTIPTNLPGLKLPEIPPSLVISSASTPMPLPQLHLFPMPTTNLASETSSSAAIPKAINPVLSVPTFPTISPLASSTPDTGSTASAASDKTNTVSSSVLPKLSISQATSSSVNYSTLSHTETPTLSLFTPNQLQSGQTPNSVSASQVAHKDVEVVHVLSSSSSEPKAPVPKEAQPPILPLPPASKVFHKPNNGASFHPRESYNYRGHGRGGWRGRGRGSGGALPVTRFTEEFDFTAMNEKFKKEEVWGQLGKNNRSHTKDKEGKETIVDGVDDSEYEREELPQSNVKPVYNKDDFFDTLSCNNVDQDSQIGRTRFSEQLKIDAETFGDSARYRGGRGGRGFNHGGRGRGSYYGRGYGYRGGRGRGQGRPISSRAS